MFINHAVIQQIERNERYQSVIDKNNGSKPIGDLGKSFGIKNKIIFKSQVKKFRADEVPDNYDKNLNSVVEKLPDIVRIPYKSKASSKYMSPIKSRKTSIMQSDAEQQFSTPNLFRSKYLQSNLLPEIMQDPYER